MTIRTILARGGLALAAVAIVALAALVTGSAIPVP